MSPFRFEVPAWEWYGWEAETLEFPAGWTICEQRMAGHYTGPLTQRDIAEKMDSPVGTSPLRELARGKRRCAVIFDEITLIL